MFFESFFLSEEITVASSVLRLDAALVFNFTAATIECFLTLLKSKLSITKLDRQITVATLSELNLFTSFKVLRLLAITVSGQSTIV